ncbi:MAG: biotin/lipoyl-binding protein, partial [Anaerolineales bacterium]
MRKNGFWSWQRLSWLKRFWWVIFTAVLLLGAGGWYVLRGTGASAQDAADDTSTAIQVATVRRGDLRVSITGTGKLVANRYVDLSFPVRGTLTELNVREGDEVSSGQVLARLGNRESLEAEVASAQLEYLQAQQTLKELQESSGVALALAYQDWVLAKSDYEDALETYERTAYARCSEEVNKKYAAALERARDNLSKKLYGSDEWIDAKNDYDTALANYSYCTAYTEGEKNKAQAALTVAEMQMKKAELTYNTLKDASGIDPDELSLAEARLKSAEAKLAQAKLNLEGATIIAPIDGTVTYLAASEGAMVGTGTFITISDLSQPK